MASMVTHTVRALALCLLATCLVAGAAEVASAQPSAAGQDAAAGARLFDAKGCVKCHAIEGSGGKVGPDLGRVTKPHSFYDLTAAMWNHLPRMTERMKQLGVPRIKLTPEEARDLAGFLYTLGYFDRPGNGESGRQLFIAKGCAGCHGGAGPGPNVDSLKQFGSPLYAAAAMWNHGPQMAETMKAKGIPRPTFTPAELRDLIAYLSPRSATLPGSAYPLPGNAESGRLLFAQKQCVQCHAVGAAGGSVGPSLTDKGVRRSPIEFAAAIWNKAPAMTAAMATRNVPIPQLSAEEMADLVAYLYASGYFVGAGSPNRGWQILSSKGCLACHGVYGERGKLATDLTAARGPSSSAGLLADLWNHTVVPAPAPGGGKMPWPTFTAQEMADLAALLQGIRRSP
jgi:mono/diheme cytochrome c family protein